MGTPNAELGEFLRTRRDRLAPDDIGLVTYGRRRVPGLRREELAQLAGVSADYLVRLEQGRDIHPSEAVLEALAGALELNDDERAHLRVLALATRRGRRGRPDPRRPPQRVRPGARRLLDALPDSPALILGRRMEILDQNPLAVALLGDLAGVNMLRLLFLDEAGRALYPDWERTASESVGFLRMQAAADGHDADLCELVGELSLRSDAFARLWAGHHVRGKTTGTKRFSHPLVGELSLDYETLNLPDPDQWLVVYTAQPGSPARTALDLLSTLNAPELPVHTP
jgi:transcriptional regulator with XRE-family HTH domain